MNILNYSLAALIFLINVLMGNQDIPGSANTVNPVPERDFPFQDIPPATSLVYPGTNGKLEKTSEARQSFPMERQGRSFRRSPPSRSC
jgi:hypothetical protein